MVVSCPRWGWICAPFETVQFMFRWWWWKIIPILKTIYANRSDCDSLRSLPLPLNRTLENCSGCVLECRCSGNLPFLIVYFVLIIAIKNKKINYVRVTTHHWFLVLSIPCSVCFLHHGFPTFFSVCCMYFVVSLHYSVTERLFFAQILSRDSEKY